MKNTFKNKLILFILIFLLLLSPFCLATDVASTSSNSGNELTNTESEDLVDETYEFIASDVYKFDNDIVIDDIVDGNVFVFGNNITISGEIGGDVFAFGGNVTIAENSYIHGAIFVFAQNIIVNGICYDVYGASENFTLGENAIIARDLRLGADRTYINGQIKRDAYITTNELVFPDNASNLISGNLEYTSSSEFIIPDGIVVGNIKYTPDTSAEISVGAIIASYINNILSALLYSLAVVLLTIWLAPNFKEKATKIFKEKAPLSFGIGLLTSIIIIVAAVALLFITGGLGFGISAAAITLFILALTIAKTVFSMACARLLATKFKTDKNIMFVVITLLVVLVISLLCIIPYIGGLIGFIVNMIGLGIIILNLIYKKNDLKNETTVIEETK